MADAKIITYGQQINAGSTAIPDNVEVALDIETTAGEDWILIDTETGAENMILAGGNYPVMVGSDQRGPRMRDGHGSSSSVGHPVYTFRGDTDTGMTHLGTSNDDALALVAGGVEGVRVVEDSSAATVQFGQDNYDPMIQQGSGTAAGSVGYAFKADTDTGLSHGGDSNSLQLVVGTIPAIHCRKDNDTSVAYVGIGGTAYDAAVNNTLLQLNGDSDEAELAFKLSGGATTTMGYRGQAVFSVDANGGFQVRNHGGTKRLQVDANGNFETVAGVVTALTDNGGTASVSTSGSSTALVGVNTAFTTDFHVGAAIKVGSVITTVTAITDDNNLTLEDAINTSSTGTTCTRDSGELFAVKTGDSKPILSVNATGALGLSSAADIVGSQGNIAIGDASLLDAIEEDGVLNTIIAQRGSGSWALASAANNILIGFGAGLDMTNAQRNVAIGTYALDDATSTQNTVAIGTNCGRKSANDCVYIGHNTGTAATGTNNTAMGKGALSASGSQSNSVAVGKDAGLNATNTATTCVGYRAGQTLTSGQSCTFIGADASAGSTATADNQTVIGANAGAHGANTVVLGSATVTSIDSHSDRTCDLGTTSYEFDAVHCVSVTEVSDARLKEDITDTVMGLDFINSLRPVSYKFKNIERKTETVTYETEEIVTDEDGNETVQVVTEEKEVVVHPGKTHNRKHQGLLAQEVKASLDAAGIDAADFGGFVDGNVVDGTDKMALRYNQFIGPLIKAVQELTARIEQLEGGD